MSWLDILRKIRGIDPAPFSNSEIALIAEHAQDEFTALLDGGPAEQDRRPHSAKHDSKQREPDRYTTMLRGSCRVKITPLADWMTIENAAEKCGLTSDSLARLVQEKRLSTLSLPGCPTLVHWRQCAYWLENKKHLEVDTSVLDGWRRQSDLARDTGIDARYLSAWAADGKIAVFKPAPRCVLLNEKEVYEVGATL